MNPVISRLTLLRFRSVVNSTIDFDNPTIFVGRNGAGKSNVVDAFSFLADAMAVPLEAVFERRGGIEAVRNRTSVRSAPPNLGIRVDFSGINGAARKARYAFSIGAKKNYEFQVLRERCDVVDAKNARWFFDRDPKKFQSNIPGLKPGVEPSALALPAAGGYEQLAPVMRTLAGLRTAAIEPGRLREMQDSDLGGRLRRDGSNAASVLRVISRQAPDDLKTIREILAEIVPTTSDVHPKKHGNQLTLEFVQKWGKKERLSFEAFNMSDGTLRAVGILAALYQRPVPTLLAVEEPEAWIHPGALGAVMDVLHAAADRMQVLVTTHSPEALDAEWVEDRHLRFVEWNDGETRVGHASDAATRALKEHLMGAGELLRSNALDAEALFAPIPMARQTSLFEELT